MDHAEQARVFLRQSDQEFASNDALQGSEKLWGATAHALMAAEEQNGRRIPGKHRKMFEAIQQHYPDLAVPYGIALSFHRNFDHDSMEDEEIDEYRPVVHQLINRLLNYNGKSNSDRK